MIQSVSGGVTSLIIGKQFVRLRSFIYLIADRDRGWKLVQKSLPRVIEYGRGEGILQVDQVRTRFRLIISFNSLSRVVDLI